LISEKIHKVEVHMKCDLCGHEEPHSAEAEAKWEVRLTEMGTHHTCPGCQEKKETADTAPTDTARCEGGCGAVPPEGFAMCHECTEGAMILNQKALDRWKAQFHDLTDDYNKLAEQSQRLVDRVRALEQCLREVRLIIGKGEPSCGN